MSGNTTAAGGASLVDDDSASLVSQILEMEEDVLSSSSMKRNESKRMLLQLNRLKQSVLEKELEESLEDAKAVSVVSPGLCNKLEHSKHSRQSDVSAQSIKSWPLTKHSRNSSSTPSPPQHPYLPRHLVEQKQTSPTPVPPLLDPLPNSICVQDNDDTSLTVPDDISSLRSSCTPTTHSIVAASRVSRQAKQRNDIIYTPDLTFHEENEETCASGVWNVFSYLTTFFIPDVLVPRPTPNAKQAWREKEAIFVIFMAISACFLLAVSLPVIYCQESKVYFDTEQVATNDWIIVLGTVYNLQAFSNFHPGGLKPRETYFGVDASPLFPRLPPTELPSICLNP
jgi:hypothetical protein